MGGVGGLCKEGAKGVKRRRGNKVQREEYRRRDKVAIARETKADARKLKPDKENVLGDRSLYNKKNWTESLGSSRKAFSIDVFFYLFLFNIYRNLLVRLRKEERRADMAD